MATTTRRGSVDLDTHGLAPSGDAHWNLTAAELYEHTLRANAGQLAAEPGPETNAHVLPPLLVEHQLVRLPARFESGF